MTTVTTGTAVLDELIDGVHVGDNLVLLGDGTATLDLLVARFAAHVPATVPVVAVAIAGPWSSPLPADAVVLDWWDGAPTAAAPGSDVAEVLATLRDADERAGAGAVFLFDRLGAVQDTWGADAALELFLSACPRLYRRRSLAVWPVDRGEHRPTFLRRLTEITQVVVEVEPDGDHQRATVRKADGRAPSVVGRSVAVTVDDGELRAIAPVTETRERLGTLLRDRRLATGLAQAEVARRVGITPSALSQVERGVRGPSGDTLIRLWEVLGVPFGPAADQGRGYVVERRSGRDRTRLQDGMVAERLVADAEVGEVWRLELAIGAAGDRAPFAAKGTEVAVVTRGVVDLHIEGRTETLQDGDTLVASSSAVTGWANPGPEPAELLWHVHPRSP